MRAGEQVIRHGGEIPGSAPWVGDFPGGIASVPAARAWARGLLAARVAPPVLDDVLLMLSELVTNAVTYSASGSTADGRVTVCVAVSPRLVHVEVTDAGSTTSAPAARAVAADSEGGRGLWLVNMIATAWGSCHDGHTGRTVWFQSAL
ncbi:ATP-binding protein [Sphaerisporangium sp. TRM90804]|uniref:ATP-binding protein n=1 Tax=Sphaerisporangium sp. TRM90804 TaxID=3031113 RepID=UPI00244B7BB6|nr:ATP-binding protein [Sphaerisporangium sp. TRM90804]MDH2424082.1 ATP-binding protein [Sphaerisporangium sp. TRM90804]